jgi:phage repressor protein C with HTH and peptisase S24 domain
MIRHEHIWRAVDHIAAQNGMSASALARAAGLDPTVFNRSKRRSAGVGKARWLSTESVAKILNATGESMAGFGILVDAAISLDELSLPAEPYRAEAARARAALVRAHAPAEREALREIAALYDRLGTLAERQSDKSDAVLAVR